MIFIEYPKCSTCIKAKKWLDDHEVEYVDRNIKEENPTYDELSLWIGKSGMNIKKFFNTSGILYKSMNLKEKLTNMSEEEMIRLLSNDGMLVKRPIIVADSYILVGFKENEWAEKLL